MIQQTYIKKHHSWIIKFTYKNSLNISYLSRQYGDLSDLSELLSLGSGVDVKIEDDTRGVKDFSTGGGCSCVVMTNTSLFE